MTKYIISHANWSRSENLFCQKRISFHPTFCLKKEKGGKEIEKRWTVGMENCHTIAQNRKGRKRWYFWTFFREFLKNGTKEVKWKGRYRCSKKRKLRSWSNFLAKHAPQKCMPGVSETGVNGYWVVCWTPDRLRSDSISNDRVSTDRLRNIRLETHVWEAKIASIHAETLVEAF